MDYLLLKKAYPERIVLVNFNHVISRTEDTAREICAALDVPFNESVLTPTSLGKPTKGNSSFLMGEEVQGTFYTLGRQREALPEEHWPHQYPAIWRIVEDVAL